MENSKMKINIGAKYEETRLDLMKRIRNEPIGALETNISEAEAIDHACYFCLKPIKGKMWILIDTHETGESKYFIDDICYQLSKKYNN